MNDPYQVKQILSQLQAAAQDAKRLAAPYIAAAAALESMLAAVNAAVTVVEDNAQLLQRNGQLKKEFAALQQEIEGLRAVRKELEGGQEDARLRLARLNGDVLDARIGAAMDRTIITPGGEAIAPKSLSKDAGGR